MSELIIFVATIILAAGVFAVIAKFLRQPPLVGYIVAGMTAFYMFRLYFRIFWWNEPNYEHTPHEAPNVYQKGEDNPL